MDGVSDDSQAAFLLVPLAPESGGDLAPAERARHRDYDAALGVLACGTKLLDVLQIRRSELEAALHYVTEQADRVTSALKSELTAVRKSNVLLSTRVQAFESRFEAMQRRIDAAEAQVDSERTRADMAERRAVSAETSLADLQSAVTSLLGLGSRAQEALSAVAPHFRGAGRTAQAGLRQAIEAVREGRGGTEDRDGAPVSAPAAAPHPDE